MTKAIQKEEEVLFTTLFVKNRLRFKQCEVVATDKEPLDCIATTTNPFGKKTVYEFELSEYFLDRHRGGSTAKSIVGFWKKLRGIIDPELDVLKLGVDMGVQFNDGFKITDKEQKPFATELVRFAQEFRPKGYLKLETHYFGTRRRSYPTFPLIEKNVERLTLGTIEGCGFLAWHCSNVMNAFVGVDFVRLADQIEEKTKKVYPLSENATRCLLIYASGTPVTSSAGPALRLEQWHQDKKLQQVCESPKFDRIYFWERVLNWHHRLK